MKKFVAFLRGINSGSNPALKMETLRKICEGLGLKNVRTVLAAGNVIFESDQTDTCSIEDILENGLAKMLGYRVTAIVKSSADIDRLIKSNPFDRIDITPQTRLYITFFKSAPAIDLTFPYFDPIKGFTILGFDAGIIRSVVDLSKGMTPDLMDFLDKKFGKKSTTRNWNTLEKIYSMIV